MNAENMLFPDNSFDLVLCDNIIEHTPHPKLMAKEISRVLAEEGMLYLTVPNKIAIGNILSDPHYGLFGVSLLPHTLLHFYIKIRGMACKFTTVYNLPTYQQVIDIFEDSGIQLIYIEDKESLNEITEKIENPKTIETPVLRLIINMIIQIGLKSVLNKIMLNKWFIKNFLVGGFTFIGKKRLDRL